MFVENSIFLYLSPQVAPRVVQLNFDNVNRIFRGKIASIPRCSNQGGSLKICYKVSCEHPRVVKNMLPKYNCLRKWIRIRADTAKGNFTIRSEPRYFLGLPKVLLTGS